MLSSYALTTLVTAKMFMGIDLTDTSQDTLLEFLINSTTDAIQKECSRIFAVGSYTFSFFVERAPSPLPMYPYNQILQAPPLLNCKKDLLLEQYPIATVSVMVDEQPFTDYKLLAESGMLRNHHGWQGKIDGSFTAGYVLPKDEVLPTTDDPVGVPRTLPYDLEETCCQLLSITYQMRGSEHNEQEDVGPMRNKYITTIPTWIKEKLEHYYKPVIT
jgi:hypothetical protein